MSTNNDAVRDKVNSHFEASQIPRNDYGGPGPIPLTYDDESNSDGDDVPVVFLGNGMIQRQTPDTKVHLVGDKNTSFTAKEKISRRTAELSEVDQILLEVELTDYLQNEVDRCNLHLKNFKLRLIMDEEIAYPTGR